MTCAHQKAIQLSLLQSNSPLQLCTSACSLCNLGRLSLGGDYARLLEDPSVRKCLRDQLEDSETNCISLIVSAAFMDIFVQANWTGPPLGDELKRIVDTLGETLSSTVEESIDFGELVFGQLDPDVVHFPNLLSWSQTLLAQSGACVDFLTEAIELSGLNAELSGCLGKRTKFQEFETAQLLLVVSKGGERSTAPVDASKEETTPRNGLPKIVPLMDDDLLDKVSYSESATPLTLTPLEEAVLLTMGKSRFSFQYILSQPLSWSIQFKALDMRSLLENTKSKLIERSMRQLEALIESFNDTSPDAVFRKHLTFSIGLPPIWTVKQHLASTLMSLGCVESARELFESMKMWEKVIECYQLQGRFKQVGMQIRVDASAKIAVFLQAEKRIRSQLEIKRTPYLLCVLGDVTSVFYGNSVYYDEAWELSEMKSARAQRSLGYYYLRKNMCSECIASFQKTLRLNSMQDKVWFSLGCVALQIGDMNLASSAFHRCVTLEPSNFEAWNNLAAVYIKKGEKSRAKTAFREALKVDYENSKVWENYLLVCIDVADFGQAMEAYNRLLDLKDKYVDEEVLSVLVRGLKCLVEEKSESASSWYRLATQLFGRITSKLTKSATVWQLYASLLDTDSTDTKEKVFLCLLKALSASLQSQKLFTDLLEFKNAADLAERVRNAWEEAMKSQRERDDAVTLDLVEKGVSIRLSVRKLIACAKQLDEDDRLDDASERIATLQRLSENVQTTYDKMKKNPEL
ncbi:tetratricopeptide repeat protein 27-like [Oscarella lobularis]|uniref:tetratricopeptide repeat protein 27-like n=1 Tax=Oscarella lobularis TaxID=121494 RepID=UPI00331359FB